MNRWIRALGIGAATGLLGVLLGVSPPGFELEKNVGLDWLFALRGTVQPPEDVVVVAIDDETGPKLGFSPKVNEWPRALTHGRLIEALTEFGASVIAYDVYFSRPGSPDDDGALAEKLAESGLVLLYEKLSGRNVPIRNEEGIQTGFIWQEDTVAPFDAAAEAARGLAPFPLPKRQITVYQAWSFKSTSLGGIATMPAQALQLHAFDAYRSWIALLNGVGAPLELPPDPTEIATPSQLRDTMRRTREAFEADPTLGPRLLEALEGPALEGLEPGHRRLIAALIHLYQGPDNWLLNFYGGPGTITTVPFHTVIESAPRSVAGQPVSLAGKVVFVGYSDVFNPGQLDRFFTPFTNDAGVDLSGVEIMATAYGNLLTASALKASGPALTAAVLFVFGLVLGVVCYLFTAYVAVPVAIGLTVVYGFGAAQSLFETANFWLPVVVPALQLPVALVLGLLGQWMLERRRERRMRQAISYYIPESVVRDLSERGLDPSAANRVVFGTCLATDMSGFTTISESMTPKELAAFMNAYFEAMSKPLTRNDVDVTEFHADSIMCAWTAEQPDAALRERALAAGLEVIEAVDAFAAGHPNIRLNARVGLDAGMIYLGHTGGGGHFAYSILGDCANTASRLEGLNKHLGTHILASQAVVDGLDRFLLRPLGRFSLVGKQDATPVFEVLGRLDTIDTRQTGLCERFAEGLSAFGAGKFAQASGSFEAVLREHPDDGPSLFYLNRCRDYQKGSVPLPDDLSVILMDVK